MSVSERLQHAGIPADAARRMEEFSEMMLLANQTHNLTRITDEEDMVNKHFLDSLAGADLLPEGATVLDIGTGAGFPGIPLAMVRPDCRYTLLDSVGKKVDFVAQTCAALELPARAICGRAEELAHEADYCAQFDVVVSRAVAPLEILLELAAGFCRVGGCFLAYKGAAAREELTRAQSAAQELGFAPAEIAACAVAGMEHAILRFVKRSPTHVSYPRRYALIKKAPIR